MITFILLIFLVWRIGLFLVSFLGEKFVEFSPSFPYSEVLLILSGLPHWIWSFANFDGVHYLTIAEKGYAAQFTQVFFPVYPLLMKILNLITPLSSGILNGLLLSSFFLFLSLLVFSRLLSLDFNSSVVKWTLLFFLFFPTAFYLGSIYTESLFLFLIFSSLFAARKKKWLLSGILGALSAATRLTGILILPALLWEWNNDLSSKNLKVYLANTFLAPVLYIVPLGLISYMVYLQWKFSDFLYFWHNQGVFGAQRSSSSIIFPPQVIYRYIKILLTVNPGSYQFFTAVNELSMTLVALLILLIFFLKKGRISYFIFSVLTLLIPMLTGTLSSMPRYVITAFPIFIVLGSIHSKGFKIMILSVSVCLLTLFTVLFTGGYWVA